MINYQVQESPHKHSFKVNRKKTDSVRIHFKCSTCKEDCQIWRNTYNLLVRIPVPYWPSSGRTM